MNQRRRIKQLQSANKKKLKDILDKHLPGDEHKELRRDITNWFKDIKDNIKPKEENDVG